MLRVLCVALILNSISISIQVSHNNLKAKNPIYFPSEIHSKNSLNYKLRNTRKTLRKDRRNFPKVGVDDWFYEDISEPLQYNYKEVWWTNNYPDPDDLTKRTTKPNEFHENFTEITNSPTPELPNHSTPISPIGRIKKNPKNYINRTNKTTIKFITNKTQNFVNLTKSTKAQIRSNTNTVKIKHTTKFIDKDKGYFLPIFSRNDSGQFSIKANHTDLNLKKNENDSDIRGSITNNIFISKDLDLEDFDFVVIEPENSKDMKKSQRQSYNNKPIVIDIVKTDNIAKEIKKTAPGEDILIGPEQSAVLSKIVKDGIYRIEIPEPITQKSIRNHQIDFDTFNQAAPQKNHPPWPVLDGPHANQDINPRYYKHGPIPNLKSPRNGPGPIYNTQNPGYDGKRPFYSTSLGQALFYSTQNPYDRQRLYNKQNSFGQNGKRPVYITQNPDNDRQRQFEPTKNFGQNRPNPPYYTKPTFFKGSSVQNFTNNVQGPPYSTIGSEHQRQSPLYNTKGLGKGRQGHLPTIQEDEEPGLIVPAGITVTEETPVYGMVLGVESPTNPYYQETKRSTITFEPGRGPIKENAPVYFQESSIGPISSYVQQILEDMTQLNMGFFSMFSIKLFEIVPKKQPEDLRPLFMQAQHEIDILFEVEHTLLYFGEPFGATIKDFVHHLSIVPIDYAQSMATMLHHTMVNRRDGVTEDINSVIDYIDSLYDDPQGVALLRVAEELEKYPNGPDRDRQSLEIHRHLSEALYAPVKKHHDTTKLQILFDSLNKLIINHSRGLDENPSIDRRRDNKNNNLSFLFTKAMTKVTNDKSNNRVAKDKLKDIRLKTPTQRLMVDKQKSNGYTKKMRHDNVFIDKSVIKNTERALELKGTTKPNHISTTRKHTFEINFPNKLTKNNREKFMNNLKQKLAAKLKSEIDKATYFIRPTKENNIKNSKVTIRYTKATPKNQIMNAKVKTQDEKIDKLKEIIAEQIFKAQADNYRIAKTVKTNILRSESNDTSVEQDEQTTTIVEVPEKESTEVFKESSGSKEQRIEKKEKKHKHQKTSHLHKKEIRHLRHKHPKMYKKYLRHLKKIKHSKKHKKKTHKEHKKKSHHSKKKKKNKVLKSFKDIEHHYERLLNHYISKKTHLNKARMSDSEKEIPIEYKDIFSIENNTDAYAYLYDTLNSIENERSKDTKPNNVTTPSSFKTPLNKATIITNEKTTENWFHYPIVSTQQISTQNLKTTTKIGSLGNDRSLNSKLLEDLEDNSKTVPNLNVKKSSSYSDEENELKFNLYDAMRHEKMFFKPERRSFDVKKKKNKLRAFSSYSSEEVVLKSNIYKAVGFNNNGRVNFSEIVKKNTAEKAKKLVFRRNFKPINELSSYSDEEDILKQKLKL